MASIVILPLISLLIPAVRAEKVFVSLQCQGKTVGQDGQQTLLECVVKPAPGVGDVMIQVLTWKKDNKPLLVFDNGNYNKKTNGYRIAEPHWNDKNMNVSLLIANTAVGNAGVYSCMVMTDSGDAESHTKLDVTAKYSAPTIHSTPEKVTRDADATLICESDGGYPEGRIRWFDADGMEWSKSSEMEAKKTQSGLFHLSSRLTLLRGSVFSKYTCVVFNASGGKEAEVVFHIDLTETEGQKGTEALSPSSKIVAPLVVIGSLIAGLLVALLVLRRRAKLARRHSTAPLMSGHQEDCRYEVGDAEASPMKEG